MAEPDCIEVEGKVIAVLPGTMFRVELPGGHQVLAHISGKLRKHFIKLTVGDMVKCEMNTYDLNKARIVYRLRNAQGFSRSHEDIMGDIDEEGNHIEREETAAPVMHRGPRTGGGPRHHRPGGHRPGGPSRRPGGSRR